MTIHLTLAGVLIGGCVVAILWWLGGRTEAQIRKFREDNKQWMDNQSGQPPLSH